MWDGIGFRERSSLYFRGKRTLERKSIQGCLKVVVKN